MSAILSADDLNDFISPGVACIKPIETIPKKQDDGLNPYEVTTEDKVAAANPAPAQISLTDCLACSGCVTSAEAVLVSLQSHNEVLNTLDAHPSLPPSWLRNGLTNGHRDGLNGYANVSTALPADGKIFIATVSPQARASLAATYNVSSTEAGNMITHLLSGPAGLPSTTPHNTSFLWVLDTNALRPLALTLAFDELSSANPKTPLLTSACPGWICYAEKTHGHILPHLSRLKSPQALAGTLLKSILASRFAVPPHRVFHLAIMPCFDKKLEAARAELTSSAWAEGDQDPAVRDVDCVITAREVVTLAEARGIEFGGLPRTEGPRVRFPDARIDRMLFPSKRGRWWANGEPAAGTSGGFLWHVLRRFQSGCPGSRIKVERGRNADIVEYLLVRPKLASEPEGKDEEVVFKAARYYGFRNIQNLVRKLKPPRKSRLLAAAAKGGGARRPGGKEAGLDYAYVEVMACPGGCTNGGGQIKVGGMIGEQSDGKETAKIGPQEQREWLGRVDEAYFSASSASEEEQEDDDDVEGEEYRNAMDIDGDVVDGISRQYIHDVLEHWRDLSGVELDKLVYTTYREVESDVGKEKKKSDVERVAGLASSIGGGW